MNTKKIQHIFFASLVVLSILSSLYINLHIEQQDSTLTEISESANETSEKLMADIDVFKKIIQKVSRQISF